VHGWTRVLKIITMRERPDGSNKLSFPSGHTSTAFCFATSVRKAWGSDVGRVA